MVFVPDNPGVEDPAGVPKRGSSTEWFLVDDAGPVFIAHGGRLVIDEVVRVAAARRLALDGEHV